MKGPQSISIAKIDFGAIFKMAASEIHLFQNDGSWVINIGPNVLKMYMYINMTCSELTNHPKQQY